MIRIVYSWKVELENQKAFIESWKKTTNKIHQEVKGARGSFMLQGAEDATIIKTIARWDALEDWENFWQQSNPIQMRSMHNLGERTSVEIFKEVDDFTK